MYQQPVAFRNTWIFTSFLYLPFFIFSKSLADSVIENAYGQAYFPMTIPEFSLRLGIILLFYFGIVIVQAWAFHEFLLDSLSAWGKYTAFGLLVGISIIFLFQWLLFRLGTLQNLDQYEMDMIRNITSIWGAVLLCLVRFVTILSQAAAFQNLEQRLQYCKVSVLGTLALVISTYGIIYLTFLFNIRDGAEIYSFLCFLPITFLTLRTYISNLEAKALVAMLNSSYPHKKPKNLLASDAL